MMTTAARDILTLDEVDPNHGYDACGFCQGRGQLLGVGRCPACNGKGYQTANDKRRYAKVMDREAVAASRLWTSPVSDSVSIRMRKSDILLRDALEPSISPPSGVADVRSAATLIVRRV